MIFYSILRKSFIASTSVNKDAVDCVKNDIHDKIDDAKKMGNKTVRVLVDKLLDVDYSKLIQELKLENINAKWYWDCDLSCYCIEIKL